MKRTIFLLLLTVAAFCACKKETTTPVENDYISFKVDGVLKTGTYCGALYSKSNVKNFSRINIIARTSNKELISFDVIDPIIGQDAGSKMEGLYTIPAGVDSTRYVVDALRELTIKTLTNDRVTGTFKFTGRNSAQNTDTKNITEGSFGCKVIVVQ